MIANLQLELRVETYSKNEPPQIWRQFLPLSALNVNGNVVQMGPLTLTNSTCTGTVNGSLDVNVTFGLSARSNQFIQHMTKFIESIIPDPFSTYGSVASQATVGSVNVSASVPLVFTTYSMNLGIDIWRWFMISTTFVGSGGGRYPDLQVEAIGFPAENGIALGTSYVYFEGVEHHLDNAFVNSTWWTQSVKQQMGSRMFSVSIQDKTIQLEISCFAPISAFAVLDSYALSDIHTTVLGSCKASVSGNTFTTSGALLEVKEFHVL